MTATPIPKHFLNSPHINTKKLLPFSMSYLSDVAEEETPSERPIQNKLTLTDPDDPRSRKIWYGFMAEPPKDLNARWIMNDFLRELSQQPGYNMWGLYKPESEEAAK